MTCELYDPEDRELNAWDAWTRTHSTPAPHQHWGNTDQDGEDRLAAAGPAHIHQDYAGGTMMTDSHSQFGFVFHICVKTRGWLLVDWEGWLDIRLPQSSQMSWDWD